MACLIPLKNKGKGETVANKNIASNGMLLFLKNNTMMGTRDTDAQNNKNKLNEA